MARVSATSSGVVPAPSSATASQSGAKVQLAVADATAEWFTPLTARFRQNASASRLTTSDGVNRREAAARARR